jgi:NTP pyrophosphatase (non-canonical NTP hydrolase)
MDIMSLEPNTSLEEYQKFIAEASIARGFAKETVAEAFTILVEEVGELAKAIRKANGQKVDAASMQHNVADELGDVLALLLDASNRLGVDLAKAFRDKELKNQSRTWV